MLSARPIIKSRSSRSLAVKGVMSKCVSGKFRLFLGFTRKPFSLAAVTVKKAPLSVISVTLAVSFPSSIRTGSSSFNVLKTSGAEQAKTIFPSASGGQTPMD